MSHLVRCCYSHISVRLYDRAASIVIPTAGFVVTNELKINQL